jgi:branched-chain amino acid transport system substrate-binding protein
MEDLYIASKATVHLGILDGFDVVYIEKISGHSPVLSKTQVGGRVLASCTGLGKAMLAYSAEEFRQDAADRLTRLTPYSITQREHFFDELASIRESGISWDREEAQLGLRCIAAPIMTPQGAPIAALSISGGPGIHLESMVSAVRLAALHIQRRVWELSWAEDPMPVSNTSVGLVAGKTEEPIKVGMITTLTGFGSYIGRDIRDGFLLAMEEEEASHLELLIEDDGHDSERALKVLERWRDREGVQVVTGIVFSDVATEVVPNVVGKGALYISPNAGPSVLANDLYHENYFAASWHNGGSAESMGVYLNEQGIDNVLIAAPEYQAGRDYVAGFKASYEGRVVAETYSDLGTIGFESELDLIASAQPTAVLSCYPAAMGVAFLRAYEERGLTGEIPMFAIAASADEELINAVGQSAVGLLSTSHWSPDLANKANKAFVTRYRNRFDRSPTSYAAQGYDTARLISTAATETAPSNDVADLRTAIRNANFKSVRGSFAFGPNQYPIQDWLLREVVMDESGRLTNRVVTKVLTNHIVDPG